MPRTATSVLFASLLVPGAAARCLGHDLLEPGFVSLFDGKDIGRHFVIKGNPQTWQVTDGGGIRSVPGGDRAMSKEEYGDFILRLDWRVSELGNSGVFLRVPSADDGSPWVSGFEVQITGGRADGGPGERDDAHCAGSLYGVVAVKPRPDEKPGVWHSFEIVCLGERVSVRSDGLLVVDARAGDNPEMKKRPARGYIGLQDSHAGGTSWVEYRNIRIARLARDGATEGFTLLTRDAGGWRKTKTGHGTGGRWELADGVWTGEQDPPGSGNGGVLITGGTYGDFETIFEVKPDWGIDSGYFLRSTEDGRAYQVLVDYHGGGGNVGGIYGEGIGGFNARNYNLKPDKSIAPAEGRSDAHPLPFPAGEWTKHWRLDDYNEVRARIASNPPVVDVWLNGVHLTHFEDREKRLEGKGSLGLQVHGGKGWPEGAKVRFRNVQVRELGK